MKEEGGRGNKSDYTNMFLRLRIITHQYIDAQSHLLHTHSLPLSLSLSLSSTHTHTHTHARACARAQHTTHTLTQSKSGELIRFLEVEEGGDSCSLSNVQ